MSEIPMASFSPIRWYSVPWFRQTTDGALSPWAPDNIGNSTGTRWQCRSVSRRWRLASDDDSHRCDWPQSRATQAAAHTKSIVATIAHGHDRWTHAICPANTGRRMSCWRMRLQWMRFGFGFVVLLGQRSHAIHLHDEWPLGKLFRPSFTVRSSPLQIISSFTLRSGKHRSIKSGRGRPERVFFFGRFI